MGLSVARAEIATVTDPARRPPGYQLVRPTARRAQATPVVLDDSQRRVVEHGGGPLIVLAGPGTGKTTTLVEAAAARAAAGVPVEHLLMLTFGRRAATELRDRLASRLGHTAREPLARTFHSYAFGILRMAAVAEALPAPRLLSGPEQDVVLRELIAGDLEAATSSWPPELAAALPTRGFAGELRDLLLRAVERGVDGPELGEYGRREGRPDWVAAGRFLTQYQDVTALGRPGAYDPAELIQAALGALRADPTLLAAERARRRRIFVDEYQDTDPAQAELLAVLADGADELVLVGDPDQSIYAFRGADPQAMRRAGDHFGDPDVVALRTSRRCGPALLAASRRVAARLPGPAEQRRITPAADLPPGRVEVHVLRSATEEASFVAGVLGRAHLQDGLGWSRMAVIVRSTALSVPVLRRALSSAGIPVAVRSEELALPEQPAVAHLLTALRCALAAPHPPAEDVAEQLLLGPIGRTDALTLRRIRRELRRRARAAGEGEEAALGTALSDPREALTLPGWARRPVERVAEAVSSGRAVLDAGGSAEDVLWSVWEHSGLAQLWARHSHEGGAAGAAADRDLDSVLALFTAAARFTDRLPQASVGQFVDQLTAQQVPGDPLFARDADRDAVQLLTAHGSKGLEWDLVCVAGVQEGTWPDLRQRGSLLGSERLVDLVAGIDQSGGVSVATQLAEERRLFYVAITRARRQLIVTAVAGQDEQPSRFLDELDPIDGERELTIRPRGIHLSDLVAELRAHVCEPGGTDQTRQAAAAELARLALAGVRGAHPDEWWGLLELSDPGAVAEPEVPVRISPSRVESFLRCELREVLSSLGARDAELVSATLGTLVHEIAADAGPTAGLDELEQLLDERWQSLDFGARWFARNERERARGILLRLVEWLRASRSELELVGIETPFEVRVGDAQLVGRVDRLERDGSGGLVVVDLKTGKSKPRADELPSHPQLGAYQLAVELGGFGPGEAAAGARLVQLAASGPPEQAQQPLSAAEDPAWIRREVDAMATRLRGGQFTATLNSFCQRCDVSTCCPLAATGRQVTQ